MLSRQTSFHLAHTTNSPAPLFIRIPLRYTNENGTLVHHNLKPILQKGVTMISMNYNDTPSFERHLKTGYLKSNFKIFHLQDNTQKNFTFHYHDFNKILIFLQGDVSYTIEGKSYDLKPFDVVLVRAGELHRPVIHSDSTYERIILYLSPDFIAQYAGKDYTLDQCFELAARANAHVLRIPYFKGSSIYHTLKAMEASYAHPEEYAQELSQRLLFLQFMIFLNRAALSHNLEFLETSTSNTKILDCLEYINTHLQEPVTADTLADKFYVSKYYLMHSFKQETGRSIGSYITTKRLLLAREYINGGMPATQACYECGFHNYSTFFRAWKKCFGSSPKQS